MLPRGPRGPREIHQAAPMPPEPPSSRVDEGTPLEVAVVQVLAENHLTLATAESCTGGLLASLITDVPGASAVFSHGFVTYANTAKIGLLGVTKEVLESHGAVSEPVACQMADGALRVSGAHLAVAITGIAGPTGGSPDKPVGTAWIALADLHTGSRAFRVFLPLARPAFKHAVCQAALNALLTLLKNR